MEQPRVLSYQDFLAIAWSVSWRAGIASTLLSIPVSILLGHITSSQWAGVAAGFLIETFAAYPVTLNRALEAHEGKGRLSVLAGNAEDKLPALSYQQSATVGAVLSLISAVLSMTAIFLLAHSVQDSQKLQEILPPVLIAIALFRLFIVLPVFIHLIAHGYFSFLFRRKQAAIPTSKTIPSSNQ